MHIDPLVRSVLSAAKTANNIGTEPGNSAQAVAYFTPILGDGDDPAMSAEALRRFVDSFMVRAFNKQFFARPMKEFSDFDSERLRGLHELGYLPVEVRVLPDGIRPSDGVPALEVRNTHMMFPWIVDALVAPLSIVARQADVPNGFCSVRPGGHGVKHTGGMTYIRSRLDKQNLLRQVFINGRMTGPKIGRVL